MGLRAHQGPLERLFPTYNLCLHVSMASATGSWKVTPAPWTYCITRPTTSSCSAESQRGCHAGSSGPGSGLIAWLPPSWLCPVAANAAPDPHIPNAHLGSMDTLGPPLACALLGFPLLCGNTVDAGVLFHV